ncbi:MAG: HAMP domain-containing histidine kinase [Ignavibacteriae bacterium]|nr:sensor histidine kinase [Ignavibacteriota bacterium]NOG96534.1 HAMP domain-containing histidine kinase [Ignavibacteriota bacterium]
MIFLVPKWAHEYEEFWITIRRRNTWFIKIRYLAGLSLFIFLALGEYLLNFQLTPIQIKAIVFVGIVIIIYNFVLQQVRPKVGCIPGQFNCMHLSLLQMILDLSLLLVLVFYTGTIDSPLYVFFIFHTIIGSLILPGYLIYIIAALVTMAYGTLIFFQHFGITGNHYLVGLYNNPPEHLFMQNAVFILVFAIMMFLSVFITNRIGANLLKREAQLKDTLTKLNEAEVAKQKYIMGVVHEIKTPIAAVQSMIQLVLQRYLGPVSEAIEDKMIRAQARSAEAISLINNVLRISKLKLLNITTTEEIDLIEIITSLVEQQSEKAKANNIQITTTDYRTTNKKINADRVLIELALSNLIGNAIKYNFIGGRVEIIIYDEAADEANVKIEINDTGAGIPAEDLDKIFTQFYRASNIKYKHEEGSGLGLYLVMEILDRHNGSIKVKSPSNLQSENRPGTSVEVTLPYCLDTDQENKDDIKTLSIRGRI